MVCDTIEDQTGNVVDEVLIQIRRDYYVYGFYTSSMQLPNNII